MRIRNVFKLNFGKVSPTNQINERKVLRSACRAAGARCAPCAAGDARRAGYRCGRRDARCADCLRCAARGLVAFARCCDAQDAMRGPMRCELVAMQCAARGLVAFARCRWRHAFDGGIFRVGKTKGFIKPLALGWPEGWVDGWVEGWVSLRNGWMV
jgi:hypothetical protein